MQCFCDKIFMNSAPKQLKGEEKIVAINCKTER